jgi:putative phosphoesterase
MGEDETLGIIADIHGDYAALEAVLEDMPDVDTLICCGDIVGYGPSPSRCVERVREEADIVVAGNHDRYVSEPRDMPFPYSTDVPRYSQLRLDEEQKEWLEELPSTEIYEGYRISHHPPATDGTDWEEIEAELEGVIHGHTHTQYIDTDPVTFNPGPVGTLRPSTVRRTRRPNLHPQYAVLNLDDDEIELHTTENPLASSIRNIASVLGLL